jgi:hypothetical protein
MKRLFIVLTLLFSASLPAQAPVAVPVGKEPHHRLVLENEYVRVFRVSVPAHDATLLHQHDLPYLYVSLGPADVVNAVAGKPEGRLVLSDGQLGYSRGGFAHIARTDAGTPFDNVTVELLHPQGDPHNLCGQVFAGLPAASCSDPSFAAKAAYGIQSEFEDAEIRVDRVRLAARSKENELATKLPWLAIGYGKSTIKVRVKGKPEKVLSEGEVAWAEDDSDASFASANGTPAEFVRIVFKKQHTQPNLP